MMSKILLGARIFLLLIGAFLIIMAVDVFEMELTVIEKIGGFFISSLPGISLIAYVYFFWKKPMYLGVGTIVLNTFFLILFQFLTHIPESLPMIFAMIIPLYIIGILFVLEGKKGNAN